MGIKSKRLESKGCGQKGSSWKRMADVSTSKNRVTGKALIGNRREADAGSAGGGEKIMRSD